jgi:hypothetical protein
MMEAKVSGKKIIASLNEVLQWVRGERTDMLVRFPGEKTRCMSIDEYAAEESKRIMTKREAALRELKN